MKQGSNMTRGHNGMRKGISLMELLVAIILLGILSSVGFTYYKNYYSTSLAAKQIKIAILIDQASQLKNSLELYSIKTGTDANATDSTSGSALEAASGLGLLESARIITSIPSTIPDMNTYGWLVEYNRSIGSTFLTTQGATNGTSSVYEQVLAYDLNGTASASDKVEYCNALNNIASDGSTNFDVLETAIGDENTSAEEVGNTFFCYNRSGASDGADMRYIFVAKVQ